MIRLTNLADYAVVLMCAVATASSRVSAQDLSSSTGIPVPTVSKILNALGRNGLLVSHRGINGGFSLAAAAEDVSVADIVEAIDGPIALTHCTETSDEDCSFTEFCSMRPKWQVINGAVRSALADVSLASLLEPVPGLFAAPAEGRAKASDKTAAE